MKSCIAIILIVLLCGVVTLSCGCGSLGGGTAKALGAKPGSVVSVADTNSERQQRLKAAHNIGWRQLVDDWDAFWLNDRSGRLSEYPIR